MDFNDDAKLDTSQIDDSRGSGGGFGGGFGGGGNFGGSGGGFGGGGMRVGGGGLVGLLIMGGIALLLGINPLTMLGAGSGSMGGLGGLQDQQIGTPVSNRNSNLATECRTGADADKKDECRIVGSVNSIQKYWVDEFQRSGYQYPLAKTVMFTGQTNSACGAASSSTGPFYCPEDRNVYIDLGFFAQLRQQFGAQGGPFAQAYVIAHEYGHHVQNLQGLLGRQSQGEGEQGASVRTELQADCYAGNWAKHAQDTGFISDVSKADIEDALNAASVIGDDRIQEKFQGRVTPESWTHGSSEQRVRWFIKGFESGSPDTCDTSRGTV